MAQPVPYVTVKRTVTLMGSSIEINVVTQNEEIGYINIEEAIAEIRRVERLISSWDPKSETSKINKFAGIRPVKVAPELFRLIRRALQISEITDGAFDITYAPLNDLWKFDESLKYLPTPEEIKKIQSKVGYTKVVLDEASSTVYLKKKGMKISFGAIGKGYAVDKAKELLLSKQVPAGLINASGDISSWGKKATGEQWLIGIADPAKKGKIESWVPLYESSAAISGMVTPYVFLNGKKYTSIIDPRNGYPTYGIEKVTVFSRSTEFADAMATALFVLGTEKGLALINQLSGTEAIIEDNTKTLFKSQGLGL